MHFNSREEIIELTPQWKGERLEDGGLMWRTAIWTHCTR